jgi:hypothetical protein
MVAIPSAASAITLRLAARNATGQYNCFLTPLLLLRRVPSATIGTRRIEGEDWMKEIKRWPSGTVAKSIMTYEPRRSF